MKNLLLEKNKNVFEKRFDEGFALLDNTIPSIFTFKKDVKVLWDSINNKTTFEDLYTSLISEGYNIEKESLYNMIEILIKSGLIICDSIKADNEYISKNNKFSDYVKYYTDMRQPTTILLEITNKCNLHCIHCYHDEAIIKLSIDEIEKMLDDLSNTTVVNLTISGGEIPMHPQWKEILELAANKGFVVAIISNFTLLTDEDADYLINSRVSIIKTSIYSCDPEIHDSIVGVKGSFEKTMSRLKYFVNKGIIPQVNIILMKKNSSTVLETVKLLKSYGCDVILDYKIFYSRKNTKQIGNLPIDKECFDELYSYGLLAKSTRANCLACQNRLRVSQNGDVYGCESLSVSIGSIKEDSIIDILNGEKRKLVIQKVSEYMPEECKTCELFESCPKCPAYAWSDHPLENKVSKLMCHYTKISS